MVSFFLHFFPTPSPIFFSSYCHTSVLILMAVLILGFVCCSVIDTSVPHAVSYLVLVVI